MTQLKIRNEQASDYEEILKMTYEAFLTLDYPGRKREDEHFLFRLLQDSEYVIPGLSFVAEQGGEIVGHILYAKSKIVCQDGTERDTITFGPLSVKPEYHRQGIGARLVSHSMDAARELGYGAVVIEGVPEYYPKLGFKRAREYGLTLKNGSTPDSFMVYELKPEYIGNRGVVHFLPPEYVKCETDDIGYDVFHRQFMRENYPDQIILRPFFDGDIALVKDWLTEPHVAEWYKHPEHWISELEKRREEFSFLTHFIVEYEGAAIGFCQYYDCFFSQEHEVWNETWHVGEKAGEVFSIDYLIGEKDYLGKGYGKEIVRLLTEKVRVLGVKRIIVQPEKENTASRHVLLANRYKDNGEDFAIELHEDSI